MVQGESPGSISSNLMRHHICLVSYSHKVGTRITHKVAPNSNCGGLDIGPFVYSVVNFHGVAKRAGFARSPCITGGTIGRG